MFDSQEEQWFSLWLREATDVGMVIEYKYHPDSIILSERKVKRIQKTYYTKVRKEQRTKFVDKFLLHPCEYQPDFLVTFTEAFRTAYPNILIETSIDCYIDIKGAFAGRNNVSAHTFPIKQKWLYEKYDIFVNKVVPVSFFKKTWVPNDVRLTSRGKVSKKWKNYPTLHTNPGSSLPTFPSTSATPQS